MPFHFEGFLLPKLFVVIVVVLIFPQHREPPPPLLPIKIAKFLARAVEARFSNENRYLSHAP
jgi:hypothetical protein